jgi:preprotein translocase subunit SecE
VGAFVQELFRVGVYKRNQGRIARQATFAALALIVTLGAWSLSEFLQDRGPFAHYLVPFVLLVAGVWAGFRIINMPSFADFLISVEGEMNKVSWPSRVELFRASMVVMVVIFFLAALLFMYDLVLTEILEFLDGMITWVFG